MEKTYKHLAYFISALFIIIIAGFYKSYFGLFPQFDAGTTWLIHVHLLLLLSWILFLIVQPILIRKGEYQAHRVLGKISYVLFVLIVLSMIGVMNKEYNEGMQQKIPLSTNLEEIFLSFSDMLMFIQFYLLAIKHKKCIPYHMRYMIGTAFIMIEPGLARLIAAFTINQHLIPITASYAVTDLPLAYLILIEKKKSRRYQPYVVILTTFIIYQSSFLFFYFTNIQYHS